MSLVSLKFESTNDKLLFSLEEALDIVESNEDLALEVSEGVMTSRRSRKKLIKDRAKSQDSKKNWRTNKTKMMKGIKKFHKSTKGKRFHRKLSRLNATRDTRSHNEWLSSVSSLSTHLFIQDGYSGSIFEEAEVSLLVEESQRLIPPLINHILEKLDTDSAIELSRFSETLEFIESLIEGKPDD